MGHYTGAKARINRRLGSMIFESAGAIRASERRSDPPGVRSKRRNKPSTYGEGLIEKQKDISQACAKDMMGGKPKTITRDNLATKAVRIMQDHAITSLAVISDDQAIEGIIHLHDILKAGVV